jgi:serine/threonine protein kinase
MGVTYKAFDVHLQCPVALKIINAQLFGNESARLRFVREARAAASVRHQNVASVFHIGESGGNYYYAMEFVEGETLAALIRRQSTKARFVRSRMPVKSPGCLVTCSTFTRFRK